MSDQVEEIKNKVDIVELIGTRVTLKKAGRYFKGLCPFHSEKSPSFIVSPERQSYKCFGCGEGGDVFSFLQKYEGMSFLEALEQLAGKVGVTLENYRPTTEDSLRKRGVEIMRLAEEYYSYLLDKHDAGREAKEYLRKRGVGRETIVTFGLGYAPEQWRGVSDFLIKKKGFTERELESVGLVITSERGVYDRFRGRIMFPLRDHKGTVVGFSGRVLTSETKEAKYINSPETLLYHKSRMLYGLWENKEYIRKGDALLLVEGELDMIASWGAGVRNAVAIKGSAFTGEMAQLISRYSKNIIFALDADNAGVEAVKRAVKVAEPLDLSIRVIKLEGGKDPGEIATVDPKHWRELVKGAVLYFDYLIESLCAKYDPQTGEGAAEITKIAIPELATITNMVVRARYVRVLSERLAVPEESVYGEIERVTKKMTLAGLKTLVKTIEQGEEQTSRQTKLEERLLALALQFYPELKTEFIKFDPTVLREGAALKIFYKLKEYAGDWEINNFAKRLPAELQIALNNAFLLPLSELVDPLREWGQVAKDLVELSLKNKLNQLAKEIATHEQSGEEGGQKIAQEEFVRVSKMLAEVSI